MEQVAQQLEGFLRPFISKIKTVCRPGGIHIALTTDDQERFFDHITFLKKQCLLSQRLDRFAADNPCVIALTHIASQTPITLHITK